MAEKYFGEMLDQPTQRTKEQIDNDTRRLAMGFADNLIENHREIVMDTAWKMMELENFKQKN